jgi:hypothetical protein
MVIPRSLNSNFESQRSGFSGNCGNRQSPPPIGNQNLGFRRLSLSLPRLVFNLASAAHGRGPRVWTQMWSTLAAPHYSPLMRSRSRRHAAPGEAGLGRATDGVAPELEEPRSWRFSRGWPPTRRRRRSAIGRAYGRTIRSPALHCYQVGSVRTRGSTGSSSPTSKLRQWRFLDEFLL